MICGVTADDRARERPNQQERPAREDEAHVPGHVKAGNRALEIAEGIVYAGIAVLLLVVAVAVLIAAARQIPGIFSSDAASTTALKMLDTLLLVFIVVELLFAVRITIARRELIAEPFLLVGIIASIKEIVVLSVKAADELGKGSVFADSMREIAVLGGLVLVLGVTAWLLRLKEREPGEGDEGGPYTPDKGGDSEQRERA